MENLIIEYLPIEQIKPYERNARQHKTEDICKGCICDCRWCPNGIGGAQ